jgi:hypothetical protein
MNTHVIRQVREERMKKLQTMSRAHERQRRATKTVDAAEEVDEEKVKRVVDIMMFGD